MLGTPRAQLRWTEMRKGMAARGRGSACRGRGGREAGEAVRLQEGGQEGQHQSPD